MKGPYFGCPDEVPGARGSRIAGGPYLFGWCSHVGMEIREFPRTGGLKIDPSTVILILGAPTM